MIHTSVITQRVIPPVGISPGIHRPPDVAGISSGKPADGILYLGKPENRRLRAGNRGKRLKCVVIFLLCGLKPPSPTGVLLQKATSSVCP